MILRLIFGGLLLITFGVTSAQEMSTSPIFQVQDKQDTISPPVQTNHEEEKEKTLVERGQELHNGHCLSCHTSKYPEDPSQIYTRADRKIDNFDSLKTQVQRCVTNLDLMWFEEDVAAVATYLDTNYYKFTKEANE